VIKSFQPPQALQYIAARLNRLLVIFVVLLLITAACSSASAAQIQSGALQQSSEGFSSAKKPLKDLPKQGQSAEKNPQPSTINASSTPVDVTDSSEPLQAAQALSPTAAQDELPAAIAQAPKVDLSLPAAPKVGARAPDFSMQSLDKSTVSLSDLLGRPILISYWATWCVPCKKELPILQKIYQENKARGLVIVTVDAIEQDEEAKVSAIVNENQLTLPVLLDSGNQFYTNYQVQFFPTSFFVDASGIIRQITLGDSNEQKLRTDIEKLLSGQY
jgi:cytochrome c biogenesis protein CcmG, thiol:disulfide interchange protein DsbE